MHPRRGTSGACRSTIQWCAGRLPTYGVVVSIPFPELRALLDDQVLSAQTILGRDLIGSYIVLPASFGRQWGLLGVVDSIGAALPISWCSSNWCAGRADVWTFDGINSRKVRRAMGERRPSLLDRFAGGDVSGRP